MSKPEGGWDWAPTPGGYEASDGRAKLVRRLPTGRARKARWVLVLKDGREFELPKKASFDHAERLLVELGVS